MKHGQNRKRVARREGRITPEAVVSEAIALLDETGIDGVNLRVLARRLGIQAPSLYWHFADKSALLAAVIERKFLEALDSVSPHPRWQDWMRDFGLKLWQAQGRMRDFLRLVLTTELPDGQMERTLQRVREAMAGLDLEETEAMRIQSSVQALVLGWSVVAHAPYAGKLATVLDFDALVRENVDLLIAGESLKLSGGKAGK